MSITTKIIITDTNIVTDLNNAGILKQFVKLNNVYISDLIMHDEINSDTGDINIIKNFKIISVTEKQLLDVNSIRMEKSKLSTYDALNFIIARDNKYILATGDKELKSYSESHGVKVIRTLKIIKLMKENNIISVREAINACVLLKENSSTRIPEVDINNLIDEFERDSVCS